MNETKTNANPYDRDPREALAELAERYGDLDDLHETVHELRDAIRDKTERTEDDLADEIAHVRELCEAVIKHALRIERATRPEEEPALPEDEKDGPVVLLMSDCYWGRSRTFLGALKMLHGETPRLMYVSADPTCRTDGMGSFCYDPKKPHFRVPLGRKVSGPHEGQPGTVEYLAPSAD